VSKRTGVEWVLQYVPRPWLAFDLAAAFTRARFTDDDPAGNRIPGAPDAVVSAGLTADNIDGWFGSLRWRHFGSRALVADNTVRSQSTSLVNGRVGYVITDKVRAYLADCRPGKNIRSPRGRSSGLRQFHRRDLDHALLRRLQGGEGEVAVADHAAHERRLELHHRVPRHRHDVRPALAGGRQQHDRARLSRSW
jgi:hypothetical protein